MKLSRILVPVDFSDTSRAALERAIGLAEAFGATIDVLHVYTLPEPMMITGAPNPVVDPGRSEVVEGALRSAAETEIARFLEGLSVAPGVALNMRIEAGPPAEVILRDSREFDLIVIGTRGGSPLAQALLGSVARRVMRAALCPVLTVGEHAAPRAA